MQSIRNMEGNEVCVDCGAPSKLVFLFCSYCFWVNKPYLEAQRLNASYLTGGNLVNSVRVLSMVSGTRASLGILN